MEYVCRPQCLHFIRHECRALELSTRMSRARAIVTPPKLPHSRQMITFIRLRRQLLMSSPRAGLLVDNSNRTMVAAKSNSSLCTIFIIILNWYDSNRKGQWNIQQTTLTQLEWIQTKWTAPIAIGWPHYEWGTHDLRLNIMTRSHHRLFVQSNNKLLVIVVLLLLFCSILQN